MAEKECKTIERAEKAAKNAVEKERKRLERVGKQKKRNEKTKKKKTRRMRVQSLRMDIGERNGDDAMDGALSQYEIIDTGKSF